MSLIEIKFVINHGAKAKPRRDQDKSSHTRDVGAQADHQPVYDGSVAPPGNYEPGIARRMDFGGIAPARRPVSAGPLRVMDTATVQAEQGMPEAAAPVVPSADIAVIAPAAGPAVAMPVVGELRQSLRLGKARWGKAAPAAGVQAALISGEASGMTAHGPVVAAPSATSAAVSAVAAEPQYVPPPAYQVPPARRPAIDLSGAATAPARYRQAAAIDMRRPVVAPAPAADAGETYTAHPRLHDEHHMPQVMPPRPRQSPGRKLAIIGGSLIAGVVLAIVGLIWLVRFVESPVEATATIDRARAAAAATPTPAPPGHVQGLYLGFDYPAALELVAQVKTDNTALEQFNVTSKVDYRQQIASSVRELPSNNMDDDASYRFRSMHPDDYKMTPETINGYRAVLATKADKTEQTLFVIGGGRLATISVTSTSQKATAAQVMAVIKPTVQLKR